MVTWFLCPRAIATAVATVAVTSIFAAAPEASAAPSESDPDPAPDNSAEHAIYHGDTWHPDTASNKALVTYFFDQAFNHGNLSVVDEFVAPSYIQHNPFVADGLEPFRQLLIALKADFPQTHSTIERVLAEGDLVLVHSNGVSVPGTKGQAVFDLFRVADGKLVEHWDVGQPVPDSTASGNDMFATLSAPQLDGPDPLAPTARDKQFVHDYFTRVNDDHDLRAIDRYLGGTYCQHDPCLANGIAPTKSAYSNILANYPEFSATSLKVIAEGDLVAVRYHYQTSPGDRGQAITDLFRVRNGKIVEHWDTIQDVPATSANGNTMF